MRLAMTKNKARSLKFAVSGLLLASGPLLGCGGSDTHVNEPVHTNEPHTNEPAPEETVNEPAPDDTIVNEPAPEAE
jgi:hypothetical protein